MKLKLKKIVEVEKQSDEDKQETLKKEALAALPVEQREVMEKALRISKSAEEKAEAVQVELKKEQDLRLTAVYVAKAQKELSKLPETAEVVGSLLKKASEAFTETESAQLEIIKFIMQWHF